MEYKQAYKIAQEVNEFFSLGFDGRQKAQLAQIVMNNANEKPYPINPVTNYGHKEGCVCLLCEAYQKTDISPA